MCWKYEVRSNGLESGVCNLGAETRSRAQSRKEVSYKKVTNSSDIQQVCSSSNDCRRPRSILAIDCMKLGFA